MTAQASGGYLLDTSVLSALAPDSPAQSAKLAEWLRAHSSELFIPCIAIAELEQGIRKLRRAGGRARADRLAIWLDDLLERHAERILPLDAQVCRLAGEIAETAMAKGRHPGFPDIAIAAIAQHAQLMLLTRNLRHFTPLGVACADPMSELPS